MMIMACSVCHPSGDWLFVFVNKDSLNILGLPSVLVKWCRSGRFPAEESEFLLQKPHQNSRIFERKTLLFPWWKSNMFPVILLLLCEEQNGKVLEKIRVPLEDSANKQKCQKDSRKKGKKCRELKQDRIVNSIITILVCSRRADLTGGKDSWNQGPHRRSCSLDLVDGDRTVN